MRHLYKVFSEIEVPVTLIVADMEDSGITMDLDFTEKLNKKYHEGLDKSIKQLDKILEPFMDTIKIYQSNGQLYTPLNFNSTPQLQLLMYDIMKIEPLEEFGKSTDKTTLNTSTKLLEVSTAPIG